MFQLNFADYLELARLIIYTVGGPVLIIGGLAKFLGDHFSKKEIEKLKSSHNKELEETKSDLEKAWSRFFRYSEKQFDLYNSLWLILNRTKDMADSLWEDATPLKIPGFSEQIRLTRRAVMDNMLLIEESHYNDLDVLLKEFEEFKIGKQKLIDIRATDNSQPLIQASEKEIKDTIKDNKGLKDKYTGIILRIGKSFREQIRG